MKRITTWAALLLCAAIPLLSACGAAEQGADGGAVQTPLASAGTAPDLAGATAITLSGGGAAVEGEGAEAEGGVITITSGGVYTVSGSLEEGRIIVDAPEAEVTLALTGADITCSYGSPLYICRAGRAAVYLAEGTENALTDGAVYTFDDPYSSAAEEEPNACLYSRADLVIEGAGSLTVTANRSSGITGRDSLAIYDSVLSVSAVSHGVTGRDSAAIERASVAVACGGDAIRSTNGEDGGLGWISVSDAALELTAGEDGIQAETALTLSGGSCTVVSGGGSGAAPSGDTSAKGLKAGTALTLNGGVYDLDCSDDAVHSNGDVTVSGGVCTISTGDDALHADGALTVSGGEITVLASYEGLEGAAVAVSGGTIRITASDDGVNAADDSGSGGFGGSSDCRIELSGGYLAVTAGGDGLDSNGTIHMSGGTVIACSTGRGDGALDCDGAFTLTGGTLLAVDGGGMSQGPGQAGQYTAAVRFDSLLPAGTHVCLEGEGRSFVWELPVSGSFLVFSSPELAGGGTYTLSYGGEYSGACADGLCSGGVYSGGEVLTELTLEDYVTRYGDPGVGNAGGGPGAGMGGGPWGGRGGTPPDGAVPETPPEGEMPGNGGMGGAPREHGGPDGKEKEKDEG